MTAFAPLPVVYEGDPTLRGMSGKASIMSASDVAQGAGGDTNIGDAMRSSSAALVNWLHAASASRSANDTPSYTGPSNPGTPPITDTSGSNTDGSSTGSTLTDWWGKMFPNSGNDIASSTSGPTDCANVDALAHPIDALTCLLDRFLFGAVALVLLGFGLYLFAKD